MSDDRPADDIDVLNRVTQILRSLPVDRRIRVVKMLCVLLGIDDAGDSAKENRPERSLFADEAPSRRIPFSQELATSPKQFLVEKQPRTDVERVACLAYYLTHYRDTPHFKTLDLSKLNTEAAQPKLSNPNYATRNAVTYGYLAQATKGQRQLSAAGEQFVNALPDRDAARTILSNLLKRRRGRSTSANKRRKKTNG